ncbi:hypothetical protein BpHYR1_031798 [Brachionus plicatilis]|uniref:Uncharacterized protein n=1 Tax=Brachionus plicatilis TaxID=10195 RepID=A0A3M7QSD2_BRAPC|nr:hypothetical protein BpHYR1_031798 [Brachionus plicatilis]
MGFFPKIKLKFNFYSNKKIFCILHDIKKNYVINSTKKEKSLDLGFILRVVNTRLRDSSGKIFYNKYAGTLTKAKKIMRDNEWQWHIQFNLLNMIIISKI